MSLPQKEQKPFNGSLILDKELEILLDDEEEMLREEEDNELMHRMTDEDEETFRKNEEEYVLQEMKREMTEIEFNLNEIEREMSDRYENFVSYIHRLELRKAKSLEEKEKIDYNYKKRLCAGLEVRRIWDVINRAEKLNDIKEIIDDQINKEINERRKKLKHINFI